MTLQELRDKLSRLREGGANANRVLCEAWISEYLSDKEELSRSIFNEIKKYIRMIYYEPLCGRVFVNFSDENIKLMEFFIEIGKDSLAKLVQEEAGMQVGVGDSDKICYFEYRDGEKIKRVRIIE